jgi:hypothetical protein
MKLIFSNQLMLLFSQHTAYTRRSFDGDPENWHQHLTLLEISNWASKNTLMSCQDMSKLGIISWSNHDLHISSHEAISFVFNFLFYHVPTIILPNFVVYLLQVPPSLPVVPFISSSVKQIVLYWNYSSTVNLQQRSSLYSSMLPWICPSISIPEVQSLLVQWPGQNWRSAKTWATCSSRPIQISNQKLYNVSWDQERYRTNFLLKQNHRTHWLW